MSTKNSGVIKNLSLSKKLSEKVKEIPSTDTTQSGLVAVVDDNIVVWSQEDCCFYAQHLQQEDAIVQTLCLTRPPLWSVQRVLVNSSGSGLLLVGRRGVGVVDLPQRWGRPHTFDGGRDNITCRIEYIAERFLVCHQRVAVVAAHWHPGSPRHSHVVVLATDHYLRVYSLRARDVPEQALAISVPRPDNILSVGGRESGRLGGSVLGEEAVDFTIAAPVVTGTESKSTCDVGDDGSSSAVSPQWPVFVLYANGDVYHTCLSLHPYKLRSRVVSGPLLLQPPRQDNYGLEWCSVSWLGEAGGVLVLATSGGRLHHCVVMNTALPDAPASTAAEDGVLQDLSSLTVGSSSSCAVWLHVYESVELELALCPAQAVSPLLLYSDATSPSRYLAVHSAGVHAVTVPLVDSLRQIALAADNTALPTGLEAGECECQVEHLVCTRALPSAPPQPVMGAALWTAAYSSHGHSSTSELLVLLASGAVVAVRLPPLLPPLPLLQPHDTVVKGEEAVSSTQSFEALVQAVLQRGVSQPVLACSASHTLDAVEALDLTNRTLHTLRTEYVAPQAVARQHILHRVRVLCDQQRALCTQLAAVQQQRQQLQEQTQALSDRQLEAQQRQQDIADRLDAVVSSALRRNPGLSGGERWFLKQLHTIQEQVPHLHDDVQHLHTKLQWHTNNVQASDSTEQDSDSKADLKLSQSTMNSLKKSIGAESEMIEKLVSRYNTLKKNLDI